MPKKEQSATAVAIPETAKKSATIMDLVTQAPTYMQRAQDIVISTKEDHTAAIVFLANNAARLKECETERDRINKPLHEAWKNSCDFFNRLAAPFTSVRAVVAEKVLDYERAEREKAEAQRLANEREAQRQRDKIAADAREAKRKADLQAENERKEAARLQKEKDDAAREAERLRAAGDTAKALELQKQSEQAGAAAIKAERRAENIETRVEAKVEALTQQAATIVAPIVEAPQLKAEGRKSRMVWKWELIDINRVDRKFLMLDESKVNALVRSMKSEAGAILGEGAFKIEEVADLSITAAK